MARRHVLKIPDGLRFMDMGPSWAGCIGLPSDGNVVHRPPPMGPGKNRRRRDAVRAALADLPPTQREALRTVFLEGRSCREAAARMGVSKSAVNRVVKEALARLRASGRLAAWAESASAPAPS